jgi:hypothetical protein
MNKRTNQLLDRLAAANPVDADTTAQVADAATREHMLRWVLAQPRTDRRSGHGRRAEPRLRRPRRPLWPLAVAGTAVALAVAVAVGLLPGRGPGSAPPASALELAARVAAAQPYHEPGPDERWYQRMRVVSYLPGGQGQQAEQVVESWYSRDGDLWTRQTVKAPGMARQTTPITRTSAAAADPSGQNVLTFDQVRALPTDPAALRARLAAAARRLPKGTSYDNAVGLLAFTYLQHPATRPEQRAALFRLVAAQPGISVRGPSTGPDGRRLVTVTFQEAGDQATGEHEEVTLDAATSQILTLRILAGDSPEEGYRPGQVVTQIDYDPTRLVPAPSD